MAEINLKFVTVGEPSPELARKIEDRLNGLALVEESEARLSEKSRVITGAEVVAAIAVTAAIVGTSANLVSAVRSFVVELKKLIAELREDSEAKDIQIEVGEEIVSVNDITEEQMERLAAG